MHTNHISQKLNLPDLFHASAVDTVTTRKTIRQFPMDSTCFLGLFSTMRKKRAFTSFAKGEKSRASPNPVFETESVRVKSVNLRLSISISDYQ